jgi:hypothetical protein
MDAVSGTKLPGSNPQIMLGHAFADTQRRGYFVGAPAVREQVQGLQLVPFQFSHQKMFCAAEAKENARSVAAAFTTAM